MPKNVFQILVSACILLVAFAQSAGSESTSSTVQIISVDENGRSIDADLVAFVCGKADLLSRFINMRANSIPYGQCVYALRFEHNSAAVQQGRIDIFMPETLAVIRVHRSAIVGASASLGTPPRFEVVGRLVRSGASVRKGPTWIRLSPVFDTDPIDVLLSPKNEFRIEASVVGTYILSVIEGGRILKTEIVSFERGRSQAPFDIRLSNTPPEVSIVTFAER